MIEDVPVPGCFQRTRERAVVLEGERSDVAEVVGLYTLGRSCTRQRLKPKHFVRMIQDFAEELFG